MQIAPSFTQRYFKWTEYDEIISSKKLNIQYVERDGLYKIWGYNGQECLICEIYLGEVPYSVVESGYSQAQNDADKAAFEATHKDNANKRLENEVTTVFEKDDKDLKLAKGKATVDAVTKKAIIKVKIAGTPGSGDGRYVAGGYAFVDTYHTDDYVTCYVEDTDRIIGWQVALAIDPDAIAPADDATVQSVTPYPLYPIVKAYYDEELEEENQGWWTWPAPQGDSTPPQGECEVEPIGGYGFLPAGFYLVMELVRSISTGTVKVCYYWGKSSD